MTLRKSTLKTIASLEEIFNKTEDPGVIKNFEMFKTLIQSDDHSRKRIYPFATIPPLIKIGSGQTLVMQNRIPLSDRSHQCDKTSSAVYANRPVFRLKCWKKSARYVVAFYRYIVSIC